MAWNRPTSNTGNATSSSRPSGHGKMPRLRKGLLAGVIVVLGAGLAAWLLMNGEAASSPLQKKDRGLIKKVASTTSKNGREIRAEKVREIRQKLNDQVKEFIKKADTNNVIRLGALPLDPNDPDNALRTQTMTEVIMLIGIEPGDPMPPVPFSFMMDDAVLESAEKNGERIITFDGGNKRFREELERWKITAKESDSEKTLQRKQELLETQLELIKGIDEGISVNDSIRAAWEYRKKAYETRQDIISAISELHQVDKDVDVTKELIKKANEKLSEDGIKAITAEDVIPDYDGDESKHADEAHTEVK